MPGLQEVQTGALRQSVYCPKILNSMAFLETDWMVIQWTQKCLKHNPCDQKLLITLMCGTGTQIPLLPHRNKDPLIFREILNWLLLPILISTCFKIKIAVSKLLIKTERSVLEERARTCACVRAHVRV